MKNKLTLLGSLFLMSMSLQAQTDDGIIRLSEFAYPVKRQNLNIPDVNGFKVLKCDFHMHTVFTDGHVWPNVRVQEAWREGLDAISYTEHMEYNPHSADVKVDHNRSHDLAVELAKENNIVLVKGTEVTRQTPPGHFNALFIQDANVLVADNNSNLDQEAIDKAYAQKAFIFWNHPGWKATAIPGSYEWIDFVEKMYQEKKLHGIEVVNGLGFHKKALDWALDRNLTIIGNTDIHNLIAHDYNIEAPGVHRTMTLVMAKDRSANGIREALEAGRTVAWSSNYLFGKEENVRNLVNASISVSPSYYEKTNSKTKVSTKYYEITNNSDLYFELEIREGKGTKRIVLYPESTQILTAEAGQSKLSYEIVSTYIRSDKHLLFDINLK
ncbi:Sb-PDE family phosphodiesterase [Sphingobacterium daejeonense]|uniref:Sb-PDE family phosphodiesterase n=1 Tax=Sphingobacterium daejeonense TaxID=371142 RepID=UPI0021A2D5FC|nr:Sb-PDE family phosphodiesterase [Sphingobacterium daejeonense]MCT1532809.1 Sb-PDE family phosphodiesterase [Sphingobacterium daejeonense]